jgi:hypothetical protein
LGYSFSDAGDLRSGFPGAKDHLRDPGAHTAVTVNPCVAKIIKRQLSQLVHGSIKVHTAVSNIFQERSDKFAVHSPGTFHGNHDDLEA